MATIYFLYRSKRQHAPLTVRLQDKDNNNKKFQFEAKTELEVPKEYWNTTRHKRRGLDAVDKRKIAEVNSKLSELEDFLLSKYKKQKPKPEQKNWLKEILYIFYNPEEDEHVDDEIKSDLITDCIQELIDNAHTRENARGGLGISLSRVKSYKNLLNVFKKYQGAKKYRVKDVDIKFGRKFLDWLLSSQNYSEGYARKKIDDLKSVCADAEINGLEVSHQLKKVKGGKTKNDFIIYLTPEELLKIEKAQLESDSLKNVRKWLLLGCNIGQRGGDLLRLSKDNFITRKGLELIELKQQKTGKNVTIPVLPTTKEILKEGLPYPIALQNFNNDLKILCNTVGINSLTEGAKIVMLDENGEILEKDEKGRYKKKGTKRKITGTFPKHELITSHVCRRTFATNQYGIFPTPLLMRITAHSTEKMFLGYIGKSAMDSAQQIADLYEKLAAKS